MMNGARGQIDALAEAAMDDPGRVAYVVNTGSDSITSVDLQAGETRRTVATDVPLIMGTLSVAAFLMLLGHVISDIIVAMVDPRIKFE